MSSTTQTHPHHPHHPQPAANATAPAPAASPAPQPQGLQPLKNWSYPFAPSDSKASANPQTYFTALSHAEDGFYPLGANGIWHGGIHFGAGTDGALRQGDGVHAITDGQVVAYRLNSKYPELQYSDGKKAAYSTGFVLVHHKLAIPPVPTSSTASASSATTSSSNPPAAPATPVQPVDEILDFYSLYMHQLDWAGYQASDQSTATSGKAAAPATPSIQHMPFWKGDKRFRVGKKATDTQDQPAPTINVADPASETKSDDPIADLINNNFKVSGSLLDTVKKLPGANTLPVATGINIRDAAKGKKIGLLPRGSEITISGAATSGWAQIAQITKGAPVGLVVGKDADANSGTGWVFLDELDSVIEPKPLDAVVVLEQPFPIKAGDVLGYLGEYQRYRDASVLPPKPKRPLLHLEVFAGDSLVAFIKKSRKRAEALPKDQSTMLVISTGANLVTPAASDQTIAPGLKLRPAPTDPKSGPWAKVQPVKVSTPSTAHGGAHGHSHAHPRPTETPEGDPLWVDRSLSGTVSVGTVNAWKNFPLQVANAKAPSASFQDVFSRAELDHLGDAARAQDDNGVHWWRISVGTGQGDSTTGWVCEKTHPQTQWVSPWAWPGFEIVDNTSVSVVNAFKRFLFVSGQLLDGEADSFKPTALNVNASELIGKLEKAIDRNADGTVTANELAQAQSTPWLAEALSHLIVRYESEWGGGMSKWDQLSSLMKDRGFIWQTELERIQKLQWWDQVKTVKGFPTEPTVYHIHPIGLIANFSGGSLTIEEARVRAFLRMLRVGEGTEQPAGYERLFGGESFIKDYGRDFSDHPRILITRTNSKGKTLKSTAAGAYQVMGYTWDDPAYIDYRRQYGIKDFSPAAQDRFCVILLKFKRNALDAVKSGNLQSAIFQHNCNKEWASLPGDMYGQGGVSMDTVNKKFAEYLADEFDGKTDLSVAIGGLDDLLK
ncbi:glycoside hydrolase family 24 protein [Paraburkholderia graminis]|uniref:Muramidase (Phage lysozyme) n=2 Tax=Paraburkholderia graminis TaxID=60548 RepID=A0ABD5C9T6_9BURK|nr:glycoside hydrolase family 104 protein [Paraburkholderia graminis]MDR6202028.1 muramidase (phage lysozyme) [Paraburkholderia graminis]